MHEYFCFLRTWFSSMWNCWLLNVPSGHYFSQKKFLVQLCEQKLIGDFNPPALRKKCRIRSYSGTHFPAFDLNTERYSMSLHIQSEFEKMRTRIIVNTDTFHAVLVGKMMLRLCFINISSYVTGQCFFFFNITINLE